MKTFFQVILTMYLASITSFIILVADIETGDCETDRTVCVSCTRTTEYGCPWRPDTWDPVGTGCELSNVDAGK